MRWVEAEFSEARKDLLSVDFSVSVVGVNLAEDSSETSDGLGTSGVQLLSKLRKEILSRHFRIM